MQICTVQHRADSAWWQLANHWYASRMCRTFKLSKTVPFLEQRKATNRRHSKVQQFQMLNPLVNTLPVPNAPSGQLEVPNFAALNGNWAFGSGCARPNLRDKFFYINAVSSPKARAQLHPFNRLLCTIWTFHWWNLQPKKVSLMGQYVFSGALTRSIFLVTVWSHDAPYLARSTNFSWCLIKSSG